MHRATSMIDPTLEVPCHLVSEKYRVRGWYHATTYHKVSRFAPGRGAIWPTILYLWYYKVLHLRYQNLALGKLIGRYIIKLELFSLDKQASSILIKVGYHLLYYIHLIGTEFRI
jgi:hypothetical protein